MLKLNMKKILLSCFIFALFCLSSVRAQDGKDDFREKVEKIKLEKLISKLELDSVTALTFTEKYKAYTKEAKELNKKRVELYKQMVQNIESGDNLDAIIQQLIDSEKEINQKKLAFSDELRIILTAKQFAKMILFERKFQNEIRKLLKDQRKEDRKEKKEKNE